MKRTVSKKPIFAKLQTALGGVFINFDDVKYLRLNKPAKTVQVGTSTHTHTWPVNQNQHNAILDESGKRYHVVAANTGIEIHRRDKAHRALLHVITPESITVVFPRGLKSVEITDAGISVNVHGLDDPLEHPLTGVTSSLAADVVRTLGVV